MMEAKLAEIKKRKEREEQERIRRAREERERIAAEAKVCHILSNYDLEKIGSKIPKIS